MPSPHNKLIKLRPITAGTNTPDAGIGAVQQYQIPLTGMTDGAGIAVGKGDVIYVSDFARHVIYKVVRGIGSSVFAGTPGLSGLVDGQAGTARFNGPTSLAIDPKGNLWVVDSGNSRVRKIDENANVFTVATIPAVAVGDQPGAIAVDSSENIFYIDNTNS